MEIVLAIILFIFVVVATVFLVKTNRKNNAIPKKVEVPTVPASDCCGAHEICEADLEKLDDSIIEYFDDEELDAYKNIDENQYNDNQIDEFREVLYTLKVSEIQNWLLSIERRKIKLPTALLPEARMLIAEQ